MTSKEALANAALKWWKEEGIAPDAKPKKCPFCGHEYLKPCSQSQSVSCLNYTNNQKRLKREQEVKEKALEEERNLQKPKKISRKN